MGELKVFRADQFDDLVATLNQSFKQDYGYVLLLDRPLSSKRIEVVETQPGLVCFATQKENWNFKQLPPYIQGYVADPNDSEQILWALEQAQRVISLKHENQQLRFKMRLETQKLQHLLNAALELSDEKEVSRLCERILSTMRHLVQAEGASLYLANVDAGTMQLVNVQNEKIHITASSIILPISEASMAGACAFRKQVVHVPDVRNIPASETFTFNDSFDKKTGYTTRSTLNFPLLKATGDLVGVIQLVNSKRSDCFTQEDIEIAKALTTHIAVSLETSILYDEIEKLFEGFIHASVTAIESRDPTTSGHSERVATYTINLARTASDSSHKAFRDIRFSELDIKQLRYASLLHDFGKIGVPEDVLLKQKKLYPNEFNELQSRMMILQLAYPDQKDEIQKMWETIKLLNEPTVLIQKLEVDLSKHLGKTMKVLDETLPLLTEKEWAKLSIPKGSLDENDRRLIESHVEHTYRFLAKIPWTRALKRLPEIAYAHHEKLDGTGYPRKLSEEKIPFESQIMAITDIYDALTASDRPYKKAVPAERALEILQLEVKGKKLNADLVQLFIDQKAYLL